LIEFSYGEEYLDIIYKYIIVIRENFSGDGPFIIKNRFGKKYSVYDNKMYILVSIRKRMVTLTELNKLHNLFYQNDNNVDLNKLLTTWTDRIEYIENNAVNSLRIDSIYYENNLKIMLFILGLAQNSLQYLGDIIMDYSGIVNNVCLTHRRLKSLSSLEFFDPLNFIVDHPLRDFVDLYKNNSISFNELANMLDYYKFSIKEASMLMTRVLYPSNEFDLIEENMMKKNITFKLDYNIEKELMKIKKIYEYLKKMYNLRPIDWLEN